MKIKNRSLNYTLCVPGKHAPKFMKIVAKVSDGQECYQFTFGPHVSIERIMNQIPLLYMDSKRPIRQSRKIAS